jgi:hypothetical protein
MAHGSAPSADVGEPEDPVRYDGSRDACEARAIGAELESLRRAARSRFIEGEMRMPHWGCSRTGR